MRNYVDLIIENIGQLCTIPAHDGRPQRGQALGDLGLVEDGAVAIENGFIIAAGPRDEVLGKYQAVSNLDAKGRVVTPGLVDPHTHLIWAGDRAAEYEQRLAGATYQEIMAAGGGINHTVELTRSASLADLVEQTEARLRAMVQYGTTTVEVKTGYGLDTETEIRMLSAIALLDSESDIDLIPTFLGAHAVPPEYADNADAYVDLLVEQMIPAAATWKAEHWPGPMFCDVFCEAGAFTLDQARRILEAGQMAGMGLRLHADEFSSLGATALAVEMRAASVDHLLVTTQHDIELLGTSRTTAVLLPATPFSLNIENTAPAHALLEAGAAIALGTDCNPGTAWCESMQMVLALATRSLRLTPAQALAAATINAAFALDRGDYVGSLEAGKQADIVIWNVPDYRYLSYRFGVNLVQTVFKNGRQVVP